MEAFCGEIIIEIKAAKSEAELIRVIGNSISQFRKGRTNESGYTMNMIVALRAMNPDGLSEQTLSNIKLAIGIFRQFQKDRKEQIF